MQCSYPERKEYLLRELGVVMLLVEPPEGVDGVAGRQHDLVLASGVVRDELGHVVDPVLVNHPDPPLQSLMLSHLRAPKQRVPVIRSLGLHDSISGHEEWGEQREDGTEPTHSKALPLDARSVTSIGG